MTGIKTGRAVGSLFFYRIEDIKMTGKKTGLKVAKRITERDFYFCFR